MTPLMLTILAALLAQTPGAPPPRFERPIAVASPGPQRLAVDATLLAGAAPFSVVRRGATPPRSVAEGGLSDLRLVAADGREVPYLLVYAPVRDSEWLRAPVQPIAPTDNAKGKTSGFEADLGRIQEINAIALRDLRGPFMKRFSLEASADRERWTQVIADGTLFDVPERQIRETQADFAAGPYRYLRLTWDDTHSARMPPVPDVSVRLAAAGAAPPPMVVPLRFERRPSEPGRSRYHVTLPGSRLPLVALRLDAGETYLFRPVTVTEPHLAAWQAEPATIGQGLLVRDHASGTALRVAIRQPSEAELDLVVEDGDNPQLDLRSVAAECAELPWIYVDAPGPLVARYGDAALPAPRYDLEAARAALHIDALPEAHWASAPVEPAIESSRPRIDPGALTGGPIDVSGFRYSREIAAGPSELVALPLDAAVLAHSAGPTREFADVRIVDANGRQVPRLVERRPEPLVIPLRAEPATPTALDLQPKSGRQRSVYHIALPFAGLPEARIALSTTAPVFERRVAIGYERPVDRGHRDPWFLPLVTADWTRTQGTPAVLTLPLGAGVSDGVQLTVVIDEGDNSALPISSVQLLVPSYRLRFGRPSSTARLVYGDVTADPPRYDLALLAPAVLTVAVTDVSMAAEGETTTGAAAVTPLVSPKMFWAILALAVIALLGVLVGLLRRAT
jgi:hypothetical protein